MDQFQIPVSDVDRRTFHVARQLLLRRPEDWDGAAARRLVHLALSRSCSSLPDAALRSIVAAAFQVGREFDSAGFLSNELKWSDIELQQGIGESIPSHLPEEARECLQRNLAAKLKGFEPDRPIVKDWVELVTRATRQEDLPDSTFDLDQKFAIARQLESIYEARLSTLAQLAEEIIEVSLEDTYASVKALVSARPKGNQALERDPRKRSTTRLDDVEITRLASLARESDRTKFAEWIRHLQPLAQCAVQRRLGGLIDASPLCRLWVKPIITQARCGLKELRIVADQSHYRILFTEDADRLIRVWAFGFRRDLDALIRGVCVDEVDVRE